MQSSTTLSSLPVSHSFVVAKAVTVLKVISRIFGTWSSTPGDFSASLCPLL
jgi:hypothetical protein